MKKKIGAERNVCEKLRFEAVSGIRRLQFLLFEYHFFKDNEESSALPLSLGWPFSPLALMLHILKSHAFVLVRLPCYFARLETKIVGLWAMQEQTESLFVASLGVAKECRHLGIGTYILEHIEAIARRMGKGWLEVDVLRKNIPARRLYEKYGFAFVQNEKMHYAVRGKKHL